MSVVAASTFAPFSARVRSAIPARSRRASPSSTRRPVATARAEAEAEAGGEGSTSSTTPRTAGRRAGLAAGAALALAAAAFPARAIGGAAVGLPDVVELTPDNFAKQVEVPGTTFVEFYAPWCPFCQRLEPIWNELPNRLKEKGVDTKIARMNVDTYVDYGERFGVTGFPTLMLFKDGRPVGQKTGLTDMNTLMKYAGYKESGPLAALAGAGAEMNLVLSGEQVQSAADELNELRRMINGEVDGDKASALAHIDAVERLFAKRAL